MTALIVLVVVISSTWVGFDASGRDFTTTGKWTMARGPVGWAVGCLLLWIIFFPAYLVQRSRASANGAKGLQGIEERRSVDDPDYTPAVDEAADFPSTPETPVSNKKWHQKASWRLLIVAVVLLLFAGWNAGAFDHALVNVGLNAKECARNGFGATFCGQELVEYRERTERAKQDAEETSRRLEETERKSEEEVKRETERAERETPYYGSSLPER
jgi:hypothetical protein